MKIKTTMRGLPWRCSGWESICQCRGHRFESWPGRIPHAAKQLGPCATAAKPVLWSLRATTTEPVCHNYWSSCSWSPCSTTREATTMRGLRTTTRGSPTHHNWREPTHSNRDPTQPKIKINKINFKTTMGYHLTPVRLAIIKKARNNKCWKGCGEKGTLLHCWWECKLIQPLWKTVWRYL